jgi:hypothetical protein
MIQPQPGSCIDMGQEDTDLIGVIFVICIRQKGWRSPSAERRSKLAEELAAITAP